MSTKNIIKILNKSSNISDVICYNAEKYKTNIFVEDGNIKLTYFEFNNLLNKCCNFFLEKGLKKNDVITLIIGNSLDFLIIYFASIRFGTIINPIPLTSEVDSILPNLKKINPKIIFCDTKYKNLSKYYNLQILKKKNFFYQKIKKSSYSKHFKLLKKINIRNTACYYFSSGTNSNSKIIKYSFQAMLKGQKALIRSNFLKKSHPKHLCILPFGHTSVLRYSIKHCICSAGSIVIFDSYWSIKKKIWEIIKSKKINYFQTVPTVLNSIFLLGIKKKYLNNNLIFIGCGSSILDINLHRNFEKKFNIKVSNLYGLSETGATHFDDPFNKNRTFGSVGKPLKGVKCKLFINKKLSSKKNIEGIIMVKSNFLMNGYFGSKKIQNNVYFKTGDLGKFDNYGNLFFIDRRKDIIIKGGVNIAPSEIEKVIKEVRGVKDIAIVGIKDNFFGENIIGHIVIDKCSTTNHKVLSYCKKKLGLFKTPINLINHEVLPKTASGKILKRYL